MLEEGERSDKWPLGSLFPENGNIDGNERGQQLRADPPTDGLADIPPNFDLSFLAEFGQLTSDQDGDNIFNRTLSPSPYFPTILPSPCPEPIEPAATRTCEHLLSPSLSSGDEIPCYLPPIRQSHDSSLLEIGSYATPTFLHEYNLFPTVFSSQNRSGQSCQCLAAVVFAVEEFEANCNSGNRAALDSIVACQKQAIKCCRSMLKCRSCMAKRENAVLLVFMTEKIVAACGRIVVLYRMKDGDAQAGSIPSSLLGCLPTDRLLYHVNVEERDFATPASSSSSKTDCTYSGSIMSTRTSTSSDWQELLLGDYEISSPLEWEHLIRVLIFLQLRAVIDLLADMTNMGSNVLGETQTASLAQAEIRVAELEKDIVSHKVVDCLPTATVLSVLQL